MFCCFDFFGDPLGLCFGQRLEILIKAAHAGDAGTTVSDVVDDFVGSAEDFAGRAVGIGVPTTGMDYPEHWLAPFAKLCGFCFRLHSGQRRIF